MSLFTEVIMSVFIQYGKEYLTVKSDECFCVESIMVNADIFIEETKINAELFYYYYHHHRCRYYFNIFLLILLSFFICIYYDHCLHHNKEKWTASVRRGISLESWSTGRPNDTASGA